MSRGLASFTWACGAAVLLDLFDFDALGRCVVPDRVELSRKG